LALLRTTPTPGAPDLSHLEIRVSTQPRPPAESPTPGALPFHAFVKGWGIAKRPLSSIPPNFCHFDGSAAQWRNPRIGSPPTQQQSGCPRSLAPGDWGVQRATSSHGDHNPKHPTTPSANGAPHTSEGRRRGPRRALLPAGVQKPLVRTPKPRGL